MLSSCPICHDGHCAPFGPSPNPPLCFRCAPLSLRMGGGMDVLNDGTKKAAGEEWVKRGGEIFYTALKNVLSVSAIFLMFLMTQTPSHNIQENLLAPL